jgi:hypothetical protein
MNYPLLVASLLMVLATGLFLLGAACLMALFRGGSEARRAARAISNDFAALLLKSPLVPGVSVIYAPPRFGSAESARLRRMLDLTFGRHEVILVLDGPSGADLDAWTSELHLTPERRTELADLPAAKVRRFYISSDPVRLLVVEKEPGGEDDAHNAGINSAQFPVIGLLDPDAEFVPELLLRLIRPMLGDVEGTLAVCAMDPRPPAPGLAGHIGALETARLWLARCAAFAAWDRVIPVPGSSILVRRDAVVAAGGFRRGVAAMFARIYADAPSRRGATRVAFVAAGASWPRQPRSWTDLREAVRRDQRQLAALLWRHGRSSGRELRGLFTVRILRPVAETAALVIAAAALAAGWISWPLAVYVLASSVTVGMVLSMTALVVRELADPVISDATRLAAALLAAIPENLGYRQIRNLWLIRAALWK